MNTSLQIWETTLEGGSIGFKTATFDILEKQKKTKKQEQIQITHLFIWNRMRI